MIKVLVAVLAVLAMASAAFAAYPVNHPCLVTQQLDPLTGVVTSVAPQARVASATPVAGGVTSIDPEKCPASYFGAQDANRRVGPESGGDAGSPGGDA